MRRLAWVLVLLALAGCSDPAPRESHGPDRSWHDRAAAPFPDHSGSVFVAVGRQLVVLGGTQYIDCSGMMSCPIGREIRAMALYRPGRDRWNKLRDLPRGMGSQPRVAALGDRLVADGPGEGDPGRIQVFDLSTRRWTAYPPPPLDPVNADHLLAHGHSVYVLTSPSNPNRPVQRLDLAMGGWTVLTREGLGEATTRSIFWTEAGLVSAGYDSSTGVPIPAVARYARGAWHRYQAPPKPISPATFVLWGGGVAMPQPRHGTPQYLDVVTGAWDPLPDGFDVKMSFLPDGRPANVGTWDTADDLVMVGGLLYALSARSQLRERALFTR